MNKLFAEWKISDEVSLKLKLRARDIIVLEKKLGESPMNIFMSASNGSVPKLTDMLVMIQAASQKFEHGIDSEKVLDLYEEYTDNGGSLVGLFSVIMDLLKVSGIIPNDEANEENKEKDENLI